MDIMVYDNSNNAPAPSFNMATYNNYNTNNQQAINAEDGFIDRNNHIQTPQYCNSNANALPVGLVVDDIGYSGSFSESIEVNVPATEDCIIYEQKSNDSMCADTSRFDQQQLYNQLRKQIQLRSFLYPQQQENISTHNFGCEPESISIPSERPALDYPLTSETNKQIHAEHKFDSNRENKSQTSLYKCEQCNTTYAKSNELQSHMVVHSDYRPFQCSICGSKFKRKSDWMRHMKHHEGDSFRTSKFVCHGVINGRIWGCKKRYSRSDARRKHWKGKHGLMCVAEYCMALMDKEIKTENAIFQRSRTYVSPQLISAINKVKGNYSKSKDIYTDMATSIGDSK